MHAHKLKITVPQDHQVEIRLPEDFPPGPAEVIVLSSFSKERESRRQPWADLLEPHPVLGKIVFHEDPSRPLDPEDWPEE
jgi:hypothetical protein